MDESSRTISIRVVPRSRREAVDPERSEIADGLRVRLALDMEGAAIEIHVAVDDVEANGALGLKQGLQ